MPRRTTAQSRRPGRSDGELPAWIKPQLSQLVREPPDGSDWLHELKFDGYRMHARLDGGRVHLLTRTGLDWTRKYPAIADALQSLPASQAYLDGELCGLRADGTTAFDIIQNAAEPGHAAALVFFLFDLLFIDGEDLTPLPLIQRTARLAKLLSGAVASLQYSDHQQGRGPAFYKLACERGGIEGIISKHADAPYVPGNRGLWRKTKCLNEDKFIVVSWSDPEGSRPYLGALLLG